MIQRAISKKAMSLWKVYPVLTLTGPRQSGKTTLIKNLDFGIPYISLEDPDMRHFALEDPRGFLSNYPNGAIIDEVQRVPELFSYIQTLVDNSSKKYVLSGSQNFQLIEQISQSLAGRTGLLRLLPLSKNEIETNYRIETPHDFIYRGCYPRLYDKDIEAIDFYPPYITTYVERDARSIKNIENLALFSKFLMLCAGRIGQPLNMNNLANDTGISPKTVRSWLSVLEASYIIYFLPPYHNNFNKRIIKSPKLYFVDTGLACSLLGIESASQLSTFHMIGNLFENMVLNEFLKYRLNRGKKFNAFFWQDRNRTEIDLLIHKPNDVVPIEIKSGSTFSKQYFKNIDHFNAITDNEQNGHVIYSGESNLNYKSHQLLSWNSLEALMSQIL